jgi:hypothetical protein
MLIGLIHDDRKSIECSVCLESDEAPLVTHSSPNGRKHPFHRKCLNQWLKENATCPVCREIIDRRVSVMTYDKKKDVWLMIALSILYAICFSAFTCIFNRTLNEDL